MKKKPEWYQYPQKKYHKYHKSYFKKRNRIKKKKGEHCVLLKSSRFSLKNSEEAKKNEIKKGIGFNKLWASESDLTSCCWAHWMNRKSVTLRISCFPAGLFYFFSFFGTGQLDPLLLSPLPLKVIPIHQPFYPNLPLPQNHIQKLFTQLQYDDDDDIHQGNCNLHQFIVMF